MISLKQILSSKFAKFVPLFLLVHGILFNINAAEWGDSYRILRAAQYLRVFTYPADEKRPPLFSFLLALRPAFLDPLFWGRLVMLLISLFCFYIFWKLLTRYVSNTKYQTLGMLIWLFNPVFLYWSIRIMSDVPFALWAILAIYLFDIWKNHLSARRVFILGVIAALGVLTRFEGYLLFVSLGFGIFLQGSNLLNIPDLFKKLFFGLRSVKALYLGGFAVVLVPYLIIRNPLNSTYFEETSRRVYDAHMVFIYVTSLAFSLGLTFALPLVGLQFKSLWNFAKQNYAMSLFVFLELLLALAWPAAIPRLFTPIIPFLIIGLVLCMSHFDEKSKNSTIALLLGTVIYYVGAQYLLKLQFLILNKAVLGIVVALSLIASLLFFKKRMVAYYLWLIALSFWAISTIWIHKDIFISIKNGAEYAAQNFKGNIGYNDVSSVSDWYLNEYYKNADHRGFYYNTEKKVNLEKQALLKANIDYLIITNEHNTSMTLDLQKRPYLEQIKEFRYNVNGAEFFTKVIKFNRN